MTITRKEVTIEYGKTFTKDYNSVKMTIKETFIINTDIQFSTKDFAIMKATEYEAIIDSKIQKPLTEDQQEHKDAIEQHNNPRTGKKGYCRFCQKKLDVTWHTNCSDCYKKHMT